MNRLEEYYEKPLEFLPERWLNNTSKSPAFMPFLMGPRVSKKNWEKYKNL